MTAAMREMPFKELKFGVWEITNWQTVKKRMKYVCLTSAQLGMTSSKNFFNDFPPVTEYTMDEATCTINCCGIMIQYPSFGPKQCCPSSGYRSKRFPGTISCNIISCQNE